MRPCRPVDEGGVCVFFWPGVWDSLSPNTPPPKKKWPNIWPRKQHRLVTVWHGLIKHVCRNEEPISQKRRELATLNKFWSFTLNQPVRVVVVVAVVVLSSFFVVVAMALYSFVTPPVFLQRSGVASNGGDKTGRRPDAIPPWAGPGLEGRHGGDWGSFAWSSCLIFGMCAGVATLLLLYGVCLLRMCRHAMGDAMAARGCFVSDCCFFVGWLVLSECSLVFGTQKVRP